MKNMNFRSKRDVKNELREALLKIDELETQLDAAVKEKTLKDKQIQVQKNVIQELRQWRDNSVDSDEYEGLREDCIELKRKLSESHHRIESLTERLNEELNEKEFLRNQIDGQSEEVEDLKRREKDCLTAIDERNAVIVEINELRGSRDSYREQLEQTLAENEELRQSLDSYHSRGRIDSNISVDDLNESMSHFWDTLDSNENESFDSVFDIKMLDIERALEEKTKLNEELSTKSKAMSEELKKMLKLRIEFETKVKRLRTDLNDKYAKEKQTFDRVFNLVENRFLTYIPLNNYFVPLGKRVLYSVTPLFILKVVKHFY